MKREFDTLLSTQVLCENIHSDKAVRIGTRLMEIASLIEYVFLQLIPPWNNGDTNRYHHSVGMFAIPQPFYKLRNVLSEISAIYTSACGMVLRGSQPTRVVHAVSMCSFYHLIRMGPPQPKRNERGRIRHAKSKTEARLILIK